MESSLEDIMINLMENGTTEVEEKLPEGAVEAPEDRPMSTLEIEYVKLMHNADDIDKKIKGIKEAYATVFNEIQKLEFEKTKLMENERPLRDEITRVLSRMPEGQRKWKGLESSFIYKSGYTKKEFDQKKFREEQPVMYEKYMIDKPVSASTTITIKLMEGTK